MTYENSDYTDAEAVTAPADARTLPFWNDARIIGDLTTPEAQAVLAQPIQVLTAPRHKTSGRDWAIWEGTVEALLEDPELLLLEHPTGEKDGTAICYASSPLSWTRNKQRMGYREKDRISAVTALAVDVDGTSKAAVSVERIETAGLFALIYTTNSHGAKKTETGDRFRVVVFLETPFPIPEDKDMRKAAQARWASLYVGFCEEVLGLSDLDSSAMNINQMQYTPRKASDDAAYEHYVIAGRALRWADMPEGDRSKYAHKTGGAAKQLDGTRAGSSGPVLLSDGFDVTQWRFDYGAHFGLFGFLDALGWDDLGESNGIRSMPCPNGHMHSDGEDSGGWAWESDDGERLFRIDCWHTSHCRGHLSDGDYIKLLEDHVAQGNACLPNGFDNLSSLLCDPSLYPDEVEAPHPSDYGVVEAVEIAFLSSPMQIKNAFAKVQANERATRDHYAALYAGVALAGEKPAAASKLAEVMGTTTYKGNDLTSLKKRGKEMMAGHLAKLDADKAEERRVSALAAAEREPAVRSLDTADPLGDTLDDALATLAYRFAAVDRNGKFRLVRKPDPSGFAGGFAMTVEYTREDFIALHEDRKVQDGKETVNPAKVFVETQPRKSGIVFAPTPVQVGPNVLNTYHGRTLKSATDGESSILKDFIFHTICREREDLYAWVWLYMAHLVQRPGEKPGSSIVTFGEGRSGKSTFGLLLSNLAAPHAMTISKGENLVGRFANDHLSNCLLAVCTEAVFACDMEVSSILKALVTDSMMTTEEKHGAVESRPSYIRIVFDSNYGQPIPIEANASAFRYLVMEVNDDHKDDRAYFGPIYEALNGSAIAKLLHELETFDPTSEGMSWDDLRTAPATPERASVAYKTLRPAQRGLISMFMDGEVTLPVDGTPTRVELVDGAPVRLPIATLNDWLRKQGHRANAGDSDAEAMFRALVGNDTSASTGRGAVAGFDGTNVRWIEFPPPEVVRAALMDRYPCLDLEAGKKPNKQTYRYAKTIRGEWPKVPVSVLLH